MKTKIYTHLWYAKDADKAAQFYASIFPDSNIVTRGSFRAACCNGWDSPARS